MGDGRLTNWITLVCAVVIVVGFLVALGGLILGST